jgi:hypothetical protein
MRYSWLSGRWIKRHVEAVAEATERLGPQRLADEYASQAGNAHRRWCDLRPAPETCTPGSHMSGGLPPSSSSARLLA